MDVQTNPTSSNGPVVGVIIVIIVLLVGAFYFLGQLRAPLMNNETATTTDDMATTTDDINSLEADLNAETFDELDAELNAY